MGALKFLSTDTIKAPNTTHQKIDLTPWDLQFLLIAPTKKGLLYHHSLQSNQIQHLKHSLSSVLAFFPPLAGRLELTDHKDNTVSCSVTCNNAGVLFIHAATTENTCVGDILGATYVPSIVDSFYPLNEIKNYEGTSQPLLAVQITELVDGFFIGFTFNHVVVDGKSSIDFINSWAEVSRGCFDQRSKLSSKLERWFPDGIQLPIRFPFSIEPEKNDSNGLNFSLSSDNEKFNPSERIFHFTKEKIAQLKSKANLEIGATNKVSSLQALFTHIWRSVIRSENFDPEENVFFMVVVGARTRFIPPLPEDYFGNAAKVCGVGMKAGELLEEGGLGKGAWEMQKMISLHSNEMLKNHYESWLRNPSIVKVASATNNNRLFSGSSPRFDVYGNDFGWGKPVAVRSGNKISGMVTVFAGIEQGSMDLQVCLPYKNLEAMGNDPDFTNVVSN